MVRYLFNLEIEPNYLPEPIPEEREEKYRETVQLLKSQGVLGQFSIQENGLIAPGHTKGLEAKRAHFHIFDRERMHNIDFTDPEDRERIIKTAPQGYSGVVSSFIRLLLTKGVGNPQKMTDKIVEGTIMTPLGRQSLHIHYIGGGLGYMEERRYGMGRRGMFLRNISRDFELYRNLRQ